MESAQHLKVGVRIRPMLDIDKSAQTCIFSDDSKSLRVLTGEDCVSSAYDHIFHDSSTHPQVFEFVSSGVLAVPKGFNCTIFAYGQTGSGKTYTMFGSNWERNNPAPQQYYAAAKGRKYASASSATLADPDGFGIVPNSIQALFENIKSKHMTVYCSFLQIYNEKLFDLLQDPRRDKALNVRERADVGVFVENLAEYVVENVEECFYLLLQGDKNRAVRQTKLNFNSSRSHTILQLCLESERANKRGNMQRGKLNLCDLAGSEKFDKENVMRREHLQEMTMINKSLSALGQVISALAKNAKHIPYRNSKLTRLLQDSLGVNTQTYLIATISPSAAYSDETISTLKFADRAKEVMIKARRNEVSATSDELVSKLQNEIFHLKSLLNLRAKGGLNKLHEEMQQLREENSMLKQITSNITVEEVEKLKTENKQLRLQLQSFKDEDSFFLTQNPSIVNLEARPTPQQVLQDLESGHTVEESLHAWRHRELTAGVNDLRGKMNKEGRCPVCTLKPPCKHYETTESLPKVQEVEEFKNKAQKTPHSTRAITAEANKPRRTPSTDRNKLMNIRYRTSNSCKRENTCLNSYKIAEQKRKEMRDTELRLIRLNKLEEYREEKVKKELAKLEEEKKREDDEKRQSAIREAKRKEYIINQKKKLQEMREAKEKQIEEIKKAHFKEEIAKKKKEVSKNKYYKKQKKLIEEYHSRKNLEDGIMLNRIDDLANDLLKNKASGL